jgi:g-D-glutamyl-meso-diaminopimelate peptidase
MLAGFYDHPPTYAHVQEAIGWMRREHRQLKAFPVGKSVLGREITALCIGDPTGSTLYVGATHGLEWLTSMLLIRFCDNILHAMECGECVSEIDVRKALLRRSVTIIPTLNPDGVEIALEGASAAGDRGPLVREICGERDPKLIWQANANGVDINHNFDAGWKTLHRMEQEDGIDAPAATRYGGVHPHSEPESAAITTFCLTYQPRSLYAIHSQGEEIYYEYGKHTPVRSRMIAQILASSSGYTLARPGGLASHGGLKDWYIDKFRRPGFTMEVGLGKNPLGLEQLDKIYRRVEEMLMMAALL